MHAKDTYDVIIHRNETITKHGLHYRAQTFCNNNKCKLVISLFSIVDLRLQQGYLRFRVSIDREIRPTLIAVIVNLHTVSSFISTSEAISKLHLSSNPKGTRNLQAWLR